jgi:hypothetical protein
MGRKLLKEPKFILDPPENLLSAFFDVDSNNWCEWSYLTELELITGSFKPLVEGDEASRG